MYNANATPESAALFDMAQIQTTAYTILERHGYGTKSQQHESEHLRQRVRLKESQWVLTFRYPTLLQTFFRM